MPKRLKNKLHSIHPNIIFLLIGLLILLGAGVYLAIKNYSEPKFRILPIDTDSDLKVTVVPDLKNEKYLNKLIAKEWYWTETVYESSIGIKPYNNLAFRIKFDGDFSFRSTSDCNSIGGNFEIFENKIKIKEIVKSEKYCMKSREEDFVSGLNNVSEIIFNDKNELLLKYKDSKTFMKFK